MMPLVVRMVKETAILSYFSFRMKKSDSKQKTAMYIHVFFVNDIKRISSVNRIEKGIFRNDLPWV